MRVIAGRLGGRRLSAPRGRGTRPTSDRVREALFSMLGDIEGAVVLDLYAGTGALGIEALSRGARRAVFVENARPALAALAENLATLGIEGEARVVAQPVARASDLVVREGPFDLILVDPPYAALAEAAATVARVVGSQGAGGGLAPGGRLVIEHASRDAAPEIPGLSLIRTRSYGEASLSLYASPDEHGEP